MRRLLIFLRDPVPGAVKTRLAAALGDQPACELYRACVELTLERLGAWRREVVLCVDPPEALGRTRTWLGDGWRMTAQQGRDLGERLAQATSQAFAEGAAQVVVIGTDSPWLRAERLDAAFAALARAEIVLGPTSDGGYYLIGLSHPADPLFHGIAWGTSSVYPTTRAAARALGWSVTVLPMGYDLDHLHDVRRFLDEEIVQGRDAILLQRIEALSRRREPCLSRTIRRWCMRRT